MILNSWFDLFRVLIVGTLAYVSLIVLLRVSGKRTLSKMNAFDFVVTIALGSTLATVLLSKEVALAEGVVALALLVGLQYVMAWLVRRSSRFESWVKAEPRLLFYQGEYIDAALRHERVTRSEVRAAVRSKGVASLESIEAVVLETNGKIAVVKQSSTENQSALVDVDTDSPRPVGQA